MDLQEMAKHELGSGQSMLLVYADEKYSSSIEGMARRWDAALDPRSVAAQPGRENPEGVTIRRQPVEPGRASWEEVLERDRAEVARLREQLRTKMQAERVQAQQALAAANAKLDQQYQKTLETLNGWQRQAQAEVARLETGLKQASANAKAGVEEQVAKARATNQTARANIKAALAARLDDLKADIESLQTEVAQERSEVSAAWNERIAQMQADLNAERARLEQLDKELGSAWDTMSQDVQEAIATSRDAVRAAEAHYRESRSGRAPGSDGANV
jgi:chromosome segregation ATPase